MQDRSHAKQQSYNKKNSGANSEASRDRSKEHASGKEKSNKKSTPLYDFAFFPNRDVAYEQLSRMTLTEDREVLDKPGAKVKHVLLRNYIENTFVRLQEEGKVVINGNEASFNTGLVNGHYQDIYAFFTKNRKSDSEIKWYFKGFFQPDGSGSYAKAHQMNPQRANYFSNINDIVFHYEKGLDLNSNHIIKERIHRFPISFLRDTLKDAPNSFDIDPSVANKALSLIDKIEAASEEQAKKAISEGEWKDFLDKNRSIFEYLRISLEYVRNKTMQRIRLNYTVAVPAYYPTKKEMNFILPLYFVNEEEPDCILLTSLTKDDDGREMYIGRTILEVEEAYRQCRLIMQPARDWLEPLIKRMRDGGQSDTASSRDHSVDASMTPVIYPSAQDYISASKDVLWMTPVIPKRVPRISGNGFDDKRIHAGNTIGCSRDPGRQKPDLVVNVQDEANSFVSQIHGQFDFDSNSESWIFVNKGRNGTKIRRGGRSYELGIDDSVRLEDGDLIYLANSDAGIRFNF